MKKLAVISDTHAQRLDELSPTLLSALRGVDLIVHAGDFTQPRVYADLKKLAEVKAVRGNMDHFELRNILPETDVFSIEGRKIGLVHGWGRPWDLALRVKPFFQDVDIIIYGHSHEAYNEKLDGVLMFNPGSARQSFGIIEIDASSVNSRIIKI